MSDPVRQRFLGYEINHIFASEIATSLGADAVKAYQLLQSIGFDLESRSNKIALLRSPETLAAIADAPASIQ
jgi:hypothetical protein